MCYCARSIDIRMCGIFGQFSTLSGGENSAVRERIAAATRLLAHRGPNDQGLEEVPLECGSVTLGHTRLSIIDLTSGGHQPMRSHDGRFLIVFNGEIYNYRELRQELRSLGHSFATESDTEVLLAAWIEWGEGSLHRLTGMFAFVVLDRLRRTLTLARDAFGVKPLYYCSAKASFCFASEIPALCALLPAKPEPNLQRAYDYLAFGSYDNTADTFFNGVHRLQPGHLLQLDLNVSGTAEPRRWWWPRIDEREGLQHADAARQLRDMFVQSVRLHLRSDVPVGAALSGGIDSSAIVCAMRLAEPDMPLHTFTFVAPGSPVDEEGWADRVNTHVGAVSHKVEVTTEELGEDLDSMIRAQGEPFGSTSIYAQYRVYRAAREAGIVVTLDGQGADELLAGYDGYPTGAVGSLLEEHRLGDAVALARAWSKWPGRGRSSALRALTSAATPIWLRALGQSLLGHKRHHHGWIDANHAREMGLALLPTRAPRAVDARGRRLVEHLRSALTGNGLAALLRHGDRNSMRWSIESRVPFLTIELAEFCLSLPESLLLSQNGETKAVFRAAMRGIVPDQILDRRDKIGFRTPENAWLRAQGPRLLDWLDAADRVPILNAARCRQHISQAISGTAPFSAASWRLINYCRWINLYT